jgi:hypothetical protein
MFPQIDRWLSYLIAANSLIKAIAFFLAWLIIWLPIAIPLAIFLKWHPSKSLTVQQKLPMLASLYSIAPFLVWGSAKIEAVSFAEYGLSLKSSFFISLALGLALGIASLAVVFLLEYWLGWLQWQNQNWHRLLSISLPILLLGLWIGITEELVFRGFLLDELTQDYFIWIAAAISSCIFALLHLIWERKETLPQVPGLWLMGMILVGAVLVDRGSLGLASGIHAGWIWGLSCLDSAQLIEYTGKGSDWFTGLGKQPLAGVAGILCLLGTGLTLWLCYVSKV